jgi:predicted enzyme related to lactoylglutathione lyase
VVLDANPWAVALHVSGVDEALECVEWLGGRRVEFVLEGL